MILKVGLKGIFFEIAKDARNLLFQLRVAFCKLLRCASEIGRGPDEDITSSVFQLQLTYQLFRSSSLDSACLDVL